MNLTNITIEFNKYDFKVGNVEAKTFGGQAIFNGALGEMRAQLSDTTIQKILMLAAPDAIAALKGAVAQITPGSIMHAGQFYLTQEEMGEANGPF